jgi:hypothetical protein
MNTEIETIRMATHDNFLVLRSTDNYIEKYLPFEIQKVVSKNISSILLKAP